MPNAKSLLPGENLYDESQPQAAQDFGAYEQPIAKVKTQIRNTIFSRKKGDEVCLDDFNIKKVLGKGSFGKVFLVQRKGDENYYAMKSIRKDILIQNDQIESTKLEKEILKTANHPFLVQMEFIFQSDTKVFFVMNFVRGGELFTHLNKVRRFPESRAKFYAAQIVSAIGYLHQKSIIYRDIKPENILMGEDGYLFLADFGLAKELTGQDMATSFCGTPEYLAPEIVKNIGHNHAVDWWSIGILIYEMIVGFPPFYHKNQNTMYELIEKFPVRFPDPEKHKIMMSEEVQDLITKLLEKQPENRLGTKEGIKEVLEHPWFSEIDLDQLHLKQIEPPFKPELTDDMDDTQNFEFNEAEPVNSVVPQSDLEIIKKRQSEFSDFSS